MIHVAELAQKLVDDGFVRAVRRYNLRKFCRALDLPACGLSFWVVDDLNYDYLNELNQKLRHDAFRFQGGSRFPRAYLDDCAYGGKRRTEFIFLTVDAGRCHPWGVLLQRCFADQVRVFGDETWFTDATSDGDALLRDRLKVQFVLDLMHFSQKPAFLSALAEFHLGLFLLTLPGLSGGATTADLIERAKEQLPEHRAQLTRIKTTADVTARLDEILYFMNQVAVS